MAEPEPTFILSLDCEGKWGMADNLRPYHRRLFTDLALASAYERLLAMLDRHRIAATFAFVMAFLLDESERKRFASILLKQGDGWLGPYQREIESGELEGWHLPGALEAVRGYSGHELACHGFCHRSLASDSCSRDQATAELGAAHEIAQAKGIVMETLVFPRNQVGNLDAVREAGFRGYRTRLARPTGTAGKVAALAEEFNLFKSSQPELPATDGLVPIPAGHFFNWRFGARRLVPPAVTVRRWTAMLDHAVRTGGVVHLWLHPHNLVTAPDTGDVLERVLADVAERCARGELKVETQAQYCRRLLAN